MWKKRNEIEKIINFKARCLHLFLYTYCSGYCTILLARCGHILKLQQNVSYWKMTKLCRNMFLSKQVIQLISTKPPLFVCFGTLFFKITPNYQCNGLLPWFCTNYFYVCPRHGFIHNLFKIFTWIMTWKWTLILK